MAARLRIGHEQSGVHGAPRLQRCKQRENPKTEAIVLQGLLTAHVGGTVAMARDLAQAGRG